jgi:hypothetical protein
MGEGVDARRVRRACEAKLRTIELPDPFTVDALCASLSHARGRPIRLVPLPDRDGAPCGLWVSTAEVDWVFHQVATSPLHQDHIILHELAHMIFDHRTVRDRAGELQAQLLPDLDPQMVATVLGRLPYSSEQEQEAEMLAGLIATHARRQLTPDAETTFGRAVNVFGPDT